MQTLGSRRFLINLSHSSPQQSRQCILPAHASSGSPAAGWRKEECEEAKGAALQNP